MPVSDMLRGLTRENLRGVWAAIHTPFDDEDRFDEETFRENLRRLAAAGVHGVYTTDSDGEFYAIELDEFKRIVDVFADETQQLGLPTQMGVTWCNTQGMIDRLRHVAARGILGAHIGHPFFMPMAPDAYLAFWEDIRRAVPETFALIHYNSPRMHNYQLGADYAVIQAVVPNLIGTKHVSGSIPEFLTLMSDAPQLSHFSGEQAMTPFMFFGARGVYSWFVNFNPTYMLAWYDEIIAGQWEQARHRQERMHAFSRTKTRLLNQPGNLHAVVTKAVAASSPFLLPNYRTRRPYVPLSRSVIDTFRQTVVEEFPDLLWLG
ncbi:MAG: dihydrodipicolinate synthase family protein [Chloroflexia bacterium]|nr:dihydrodipicolinate synthase family protein [Chloroflexia bacterium]